jgi:hypothetical protein
MQKVFNALLAGLGATIVLSLLMVLKTKMGVMPDLDIINMIAVTMGGGAALGWAVHFIIGVVGYGAAMVILNERLPSDSPIGHGVIIGFLGWLIMMIMVMPIAGVGLFGMAMGLMAPMMTLVLHLIFGTVLGWTYGKLLSNSTPRAGLR